MPRRADPAPAEPSCPPVPPAADPGARGWARAARAAARRLLDLGLRGAGQVVFQDHPWAGLCFLLAIAWASWAAAAPALLCGAVLGLFVSTTMACMLAVDEAARRQGLFGFNGLLVGVALPTLLAPTAAMWLLLVLGAAASTPVMQGMSRLMRRLELPALTAPFLLTTWALLLAARGLSLPPWLPAPPLPPPAAAPMAAATLALGGEPMAQLVPLLRALVLAPAQVFLLGDPGSGLLVLLGLALASLRAAAWALLGSALALVVALLLAPALALDATAIGRGLYGFSPVLTAVALGSAFPAAGRRAAGAAVLATVLTVLVQALLNRALAALALPALTTPFVLVSWLFLRARRRVKARA